MVDKDLTIIIPHYNSIETLYLMLDSIVPEGKGVEVLVVDDKSDPGNSDFSDLKHKFPDVIFLRNETDKKGAGVCRNTGLSYLKTRWVMFADADDCLIAGWYKTVSSYFTCDKDIVYFPPEGARGKYYRDLMRYYMITGKKHEYILRLNHNIPVSKLIRSSLIIENKITFDEIMWANDVCFSVKSGIAASRVDACPVPIYRIVDHEGSLTTIATPEAFFVRADANIRRMAIIRDNVSRSIYKSYQGGIAAYYYLTVRRLFGYKAASKIYDMAKKYNVPFFPSVLCILNKLYQGIVLKLNPKAYTVVVGNPAKVVKRRIAGGQEDLAFGKQNNDKI